jgi:hypothetical protein
MQEKIADAFSEYTLIFHHWVEDRENSLWNDRYRRSENSEHTIKTANFDRPDGDRYAIIDHLVVRKPFYELFKAKFTLEDELKSDYWTISSRSRHYDENWDDHWSDDHRDSEPDPSHFEVLDDLLEKAAPHLTHIDYKKMFERCVKKVDASIHDYYDHSEIRYFRCDIKELFDFLCEYNYLDESEAFKNGY